jgi:hypothetical protein
VETRQFPRRQPATTRWKTWIVAWWQ